MATRNCQAFDSLAEQIHRQRKYAWNLEKDVPWHLGVNPSRYFLPLDSDAIVFPKLNATERLCLSQFAGLFVNSTISEMESVIDHFRDSAWRRFLREYPVNPEMEELGELFFEEEVKHSRLFRRFNEISLESMGIDPKLMSELLPQLFGSRFLDQIAKNSKQGGHAFWWLVSSVEEISIQIFREMAPHQDAIDPLFYAIHKRHMEEETRHSNYAALILDMVQKNGRSIRSLFHRKTDLILAQTLSATWFLSELQKIWRVKGMGSLHPFFATLSSVLSSFSGNGRWKLPRILFSSSPYISLFLNLRFHPETFRAAREFRVPRIPMPRPACAATFAEFPRS